MKSTRNLGSGGPPVGAVGYGAMGLEGYYGAADEANAVDVIRHALDEGCSLIDTADAYGNGHNEELIGRPGSPCPQGSSHCRSPIRVFPLAAGGGNGNAADPA